MVRYNHTESASYYPSFLIGAIQSRQRNRSTRRGVERPVRNPSERPIDAQSGAVGVKDESVDGELADLIEAWGHLPNSVKAGIVAMVRACSR